MADAEKVWQGLSASDIMGKQRYCKPSSGDQSIEMLSNMLSC
jgi:hypothetical protein